MWAAFFDGQEVLIFASLWPKDFEAVKGALTALLASPTPYRIVLVPHEPKGPFVGKLLQWFEDKNVAAKAWSKWLPCPDETSHLVVDGVGFLAELYRVASAVFVGGSFKGRVHNVIEPAGYGKPVFTGPFIQNSGEAQEMRRDGILTQVEDGPELAAAISALFKDPAALAERGKKLEAFLHSRDGAGDRYAEILIRT